jgi:peptide/nickel transport system substrate-binding protein
MRILGGVTLTILILSGCGQPSNQNQALVDFADTNFLALPDAASWQEDWPERRSLHFHWMTEPTSLHPTNGIEVGKYMLFSLIHGYSVYLDIRALGMRPDVAEDLPEVSNDGLTYTFTLRKDATWDDGSPVSSDDALFTYKANICPLVQNQELKSYLDQIEDVRTIDPHKFAVKMKQSYLYNDYVHGEMVLLQEKKYDANRVLRNFTLPQLLDAQFDQHFSTPELVAWAASFNDAKMGTDLNLINGCGPYRIVRWNPGQSLTLVRKQNHWTESLPAKEKKHLSGPDTLVFITLLDETSVQLELKKQAIDVSTSLSSVAMEALTKDSLFTRNYHAAYVPSFSYAFIALNNKPDGKKRKKYFDDPKVRRALAHLTPVQEIIDVVYQGQAGIMTGPVSPQKKEYLSSLTAIPFQVDKAKAMLERAGWKDSDGNGIVDKMVDGQKVEMTPEFAYNAASPVGQQIAEIVVNGMKQGGVSPVIVPYSSALLREKGSAHDFDMLMTAFSSSAAPEDFKQLWHTESWINQGTNYTGFGDKETDALIDSIRFQPDFSKRIPLIHAFQQKVYDDQPWIPLTYMYRKIVVHKRWKGAALYYERPFVLLNEMALPPPPAKP